MKTNKLIIRVSDDFKARIESAAIFLDITKSELIRDAVRTELERIEQKRRTIAQTQTQTA